jgi:hypothetical protein
MAMSSASAATTGASCSRAAKASKARRKEVPGPGRISGSSASSANKGAWQGPHPSWRSDQTYGLLGQLMHQQGAARLTAWCKVRQHHVQSKHIEVAQKFRLAPGSQHHIDVRASDQRPHELHLKVAR